MLDTIHSLLAEVQVFEPQNKEELEKFRIRFLGKKGVLNDIFNDFKALPPEEKKEAGKVVNELKQAAEEKLAAFKDVFETANQNNTEKIDISLPPAPIANGSRHPLSLIRKQIIEIFQRLGFTLSDGPEITDDFHNFEALNFEEDHPARDMQDTFFVENGESKLLRTHTSNVQVLEMLKGQLPIRTISPGRVYRNETISARAHCQFHQIEGLYVAEDVSFADLKQTLYQFVRELFGMESKIRFRPSYFPFTEPSAEMDISCHICGGEGCNVCKHTGWVEILGCGMVDPNVLENCGIDNVKYTAYAFGMGIERIAMLKYGVKDLRLFYENDIRLLKQFHSEML